MRTYLRAKIHQARVTEANLDYIGSVTIDEDLMEASDIHEFEKVLVVDNTNGARLETYVIRGARGSGVICINGGAAHLVKVGDEVIIMAFETAERAPVPRMILCDAANRIIARLDDPSADLHAINAALRA